MKKIERRSFLKGIGAALAMAVIPVLPKIPEIPVEETVVPEIPETEVVHVSTEPGTFRCTDYAPTVTIQEYTPGMTLKYEDLNEKDPICENCMYESYCMQSGRMFEKYGDGTGKFYPERWNKKMQNIFYRKAKFATLNKEV